MEDSKVLYQEKTELLKALSHPLRLQIVRGLLVGGCRNVRCMEEGTGQSQSTITTAPVPDFKARRGDRCLMILPW